MHVARIVLIALLMPTLALARSTAPIVVHVGALPMAALQSPASDLAQLTTDLDGVSDPNERPTNTLAKIPSGYADDYFASGKPQKLPDGWTMTWKRVGLMGVDTVATLHRGENVDVAFSGGGLSSALFRFMGAPAGSIFGVVDLNSRFMAVHGTGTWSYRFVDKQTGIVLPYALADNPNHMTHLFVDRDGMPYVEIVSTSVCLEWAKTPTCLRTKITSARSPNVDLQADGVRRLEFEHASLRAPLTSEQASHWMTPAATTR